MELDDYRWLVSEQATLWLARATTDNRSTVQVASSLRKDLSAERTHLVLEQVELRQRARAKFPQPEQMFFTRKGLEQATDLWVARYKANQFPSGAPVADLCCGIGGDMLAVADRGPVFAIDREPVSVLIAKANADGLGLSQELNTLVGDVSAVALDEMSAWHIDPDRRAQGHRVTRTEYMEPPLSVIEELLKKNPRGAIKLAPSSEISIAQPISISREWISRGGECKQLMAWCKPDGHHSPTCKATVLDRGGTVRRVVSGEPGIPELGALGRFLYEPDAAILAAKLVGQISAELQIKSFGDGGYLTGDTPIDDDGLDAFEIMDAMPFDRKRLAAWLGERRIGDLEVKSRDGTSNANQLQREFSTRGDQQITLLLTRVQKQTWAVLAKRIIAGG